MLVLKYFLALQAVYAAAIGKIGNDDAEGANASVIPTLTGVDFKSTIANGSWFVKFFSPQCGHCIALAPYWEQAGVKYEALGETHDFHLASVDCLASGDLCGAQSITHYPMLFLYKDGVKIDEYLNIGSDDPLVPISNFIEKHAPKSFAEEPVDDSRVQVKKPPEVKQTTAGGKVSSGPDFVKGGQASGKKESLSGSAGSPEMSSGSSESLGTKDASGTLNNIAEKSKADLKNGAEQPNEPAPKLAKPLMSSDFAGSSESKAMPQNPTGTSVNLTPETFTKLVTNTEDGWFIKFYAPWCSHCKAMAPAWNELANDSKDKLNVGEVNCEAESRLCKDVKIRGYPTLLYFQGKEHIEYTGLRGLGDLIAFASKASSAVIKDVDAAAFEAIQKTQEVIFLYFYDSATTTEDFEALKKTSLELIGHAPLVKTSSSILASKFRATTFPKLMVIRDGTPQYYNALGPADMRDHKKILSWMKTAWLPIVPELSAENSHEIMEGRVVVLSVLDPSAAGFDKHRALMKEVAHDYTEQRAAEDQTEKQGQREYKQNKIDEATKKGDTKAIQNAKDLRVKVVDRQEVGFAWVNGIFWDEWLAAAYGIDLSKTDGAKVIINELDRSRYWDVDAHGDTLTFDKTRLLETLTTIIESPNKIPSKSTKNSLEAAYYAARRAGSGHPFIIAFLSVGVLAAILLVATRGKKRGGISLGTDRGRSSPFSGMGNGKFD